ncbi:unnamed protein product [Tilletia controversa]|nr:unnamed protein product [Tilletia controversa]
MRASLLPSVRRRRGRRRPGKLGGKENIRRPEDAETEEDISHPEGREAEEADRRSITEAVNRTVLVAAPQDHPREDLQVVHPDRQDPQERQAREADIREGIGDRNETIGPESLDNRSWYWLIGMESVARLLIYSSPGVDATEGDVMPLLNQRSVSELVGLVHNGLPSVWLTRLYEPMETATLWNDYVLKMTKRESYIRAELDVWIRSSSCSSDSDSDTSGGRTAESGDDGGRFRKKVAATRRSSRKKIRASAVDTNSRPASSLSPLTEEERLQRRKGREAGGCFVCHKPGHIARNCPDAHNEKTKAYVRRVETACPRIEKLIYAALRGESTSGSTSGSDDDASSTSSHDIRRIR